MAAAQTPTTACSEIELPLNFILSPQITYMANDSEHSNTSGIPSDLQD